MRWYTLLRPHPVIFLTWDIHTKRGNKKTWFDMLFCLFVLQNSLFCHKEVTRNFSYTFSSHYLTFFFIASYIAPVVHYDIIICVSNRLISSWKSKLATLEIRIKSIIKTGRKENLLDKFYKSANYTALWWLSRFFLYLISFVRNQVVGKKRSTTQIPSAAMLEPVLKYLESICTTYYVVYNRIRNYVLQWPTNISHGCFANLKCLNSQCPKFEFKHCKLWNSSCFTYEL